MEIHDRSSGKIGRPQVERVSDVIDLTRPNRDRIAEVVHEAEERMLHGTQRSDRPEAAHAAAGQTRKDEPAAARDRIEVSAAAQALASEDPAETSRREQRVAEIRSAIQDGTLVTPERADRAAQRLLGG